RLHDLVGRELAAQQMAVKRVPTRGGIAETPRRGVVLREPPGLNVAAGDRRLGRGVEQLDEVGGGGPGGVQEPAAAAAGRRGCPRLRAKGDPESGRQALGGLRKRQALGRSEELEDGTPGPAA